MVRGGHGNSSTNGRVGFTPGQAGARGAAPVHEIVGVVVTVRLGLHVVRKYGGIPPMFSGGVGKLLGINGLWAYGKWE